MALYSVLPTPFSSRAGGLEGKKLPKFFCLFVCLFTFLPQDNFTISINRDRGATLRFFFWEGGHISDSILGGGGAQDTFSCITL